MKYYNFFIILFLAPMCINDVKSQNKVVINKYFEDLFIYESNYKIELPYKFKVKKVRTKRSGSLAVYSYCFSPRKKRVKLELDLTARPDPEDSIINYFKNTGADVQIEGEITIIKLYENSENFGNISHVLLYKKFLVNSKPQNFELHITGDPLIIKEDLTKLITSFDESTISN
jgi:hypothetical protein